MKEIFKLSYKNFKAAFIQMWKCFNKCLQHTLKINEKRTSHQRSESYKEEPNENFGIEKCNNSNF